MFQIGLGSTHSVNRVAKITAQTQFDVASLHSKPEVASSARMVDDGTGKTEVWVVENFDIVPVDDYLHGQFFAGDCYVVKYTYLVRNKPCYILYYWIGSDSSKDEQGWILFKAMQHYVCHHHRFHVSDRSAAFHQKCTYSLSVITSFRLPFCS